jgi:putative phage-type endonuclease
VTRRGSCVFPRPVEWLTTASTPREVWLQERSGGVGGSDLPAILGRSRFTTAWALWAERRGLIDPEDGRDAERREWGDVLEDAVAKRWALQLGAVIRRCGMVADPHRPWRRASIDRVVLHPGTRRAAGLLEVKTTSERSGWEDDDDLAARYVTQIQWYLGITGLEVADLVVLVGGQQLRTWVVQADPATFEAMCKAADRFWHDNILGGQAPPLVPDDSGILNQRLPADPDETAAVADCEVLDMLRMARLARVEAKWWDGTADLAEAAVKAHMGPATELQDSDGRAVATWRPQTRTTVSAKRLREQYAYIADELETTSTSRRFIDKEDKVS